MLTFENVRERYKNTFAYNEKQFIQRVSSKFTYPEGPVPRVGYVITNKVVFPSGKIVDYVSWYFKSVKEFDEFVTLLEKQSD